MDQLETLILPTESVPFNEQLLTVRGLGLADITFVVRHHKDVLSELYTRATEGKLEGDVQSIALALLDDFAPLASMVIACALDAGSSEKARANAARLPFSVQSDLIEKIIALTLVGEGGLEKLMENIMRVIQAVARQSSPRA